MQHVRNVQIKILISYDLINFNLCPWDIMIHPLITNCPSYRLDVHCLNDMVYVYYNIRLLVRQINKVPDTDAIVLDLIHTTSSWRMEIEETVMEEAPEWLEHDVDELEGEEVSEPEDLPLT